ncbi:AMP-binding protein [Paenibacillus sp. B01]|uniref:AMP-binding protein n=1 Tax=Paenibacillus sp. B01 TaxID=2660554 RepID=UPI00129B2D9C|nr:AMP-binding protein [Paenibacillus sp. B01]QGG57189.1 AMP-binding protein [Paenibacillus sp. B01]
MSSRFESHWSGFRRLPHLARPSGRLYALCLESREETAALALYLREEGGSALLLSEDMPLDAAFETSLESGCCGLVYGRAEQFLAGPQPQERTPWEPSLLQHSSGTTGRSKLLRRTWAEIAEETADYNRALEQAGAGADSGLTTVVLAPVSHSFGLLCGVVATLARGAEPVLAPARNPKAMLAALREHPRHLAYGVPLLFHLISSLAGEGMRFHRLLSSGAPMTEPLFERLQAQADTLMQQYGCTELGCVSLSARMAGVQDIGTELGRFEARAGGGPDEPAELTLRRRGPLAASSSEYGRGVGASWRPLSAAEKRSGERRPDGIVLPDPGGRLPERGAAAAQAEFRTGDLAYRAEDGGLRLVARVDDVINIGGRKVYPAAVERALLQVAGVREAVVYGSRHPVMGERVSARVVADGSVGDEAIREACRRLLPAYQVPAAIALVSSLPALPSGKISRARLRREEES